MADLSYRKPYTTYEDHDVQGPKQQHYTTDASTAKYPITRGGGVLCSVSFGSAGGINSGTLAIWDQGTAHSYEAITPLYRVIASSAVVTNLSGGSVTNPWGNQRLVVSIGGGTPNIGSGNVRIYGKDWNGRELIEDIAISTATGLGAAEVHYNNGNYWFNEVDQIEIPAMPAVGGPGATFTVGTRKGTKLLEFNLESIKDGKYDFEIPVTEGIKVETSKVIPVVTTYISRE